MARTTVTVTLDAALAAALREAGILPVEAVPAPAKKATAKKAAAKKVTQVEEAPAFIVERAANKTWNKIVAAGLREAGIAPVGEAWEQARELRKAGAGTETAIAAVIRMAAKK